MRLLAAMVAAFVCSPVIAADYLGKVLDLGTLNVLPAC
jgi:hypothetical protein